VTFVAGLAALGLTAPVGLFAQDSVSGSDLPERELTLAGAIAEALEGNADLRMASAQRAMAEAEASGAGAVFWPRLDLESGYMRSVDPVFSFGTKLRQESFAEEDFALDGLNNPVTIADWRNTATLSWNIISPSEWSGRSAAASRAEAATWTETRSREATVLRTEALYLDAQRAAAQTAAARRAEEASRSTRGVFARQVEEGVLTRAELLQAEADLSFAKARLIQADRAERDALRRLAVFLGWEPATLPVLTDSLALDRPALKEHAPPAAEKFEATARADVRALSSARDAAAADRRRAAMAYLPALGVFASYSVHGRDAFASDGENWTVGVGLRWTLFAGLGRRAEAQRARAAREVAVTRHETALREARAELAQARAAIVAARQAVVASVAADSAATAGTELMRRRFEEGLATATDLLNAESRTAAARSRAIDSLADYRLALATHRFVVTQH
jgi:outer membrane protein TolC